MKIKISLSKAKPEAERTVVLKGSQECVDRVATFLGMLVYNGNIGHSGVFGLGWDGDGSDKLDVDGIDDAVNKDGYAACGAYGGDVEVMGDSGSFYVYTTSKQKLVFAKGKRTF